MTGKSAHETPETSARSTWRILPDMPLTIWMVLSALAIAFAGGMTPEAAIGAFNDGFGRSVGEFALILLPSFVIAAAMSRAEILPDNPGRIAALASPLAGAGMICPDTAFAALSPATADRKLDVAFAPMRASSSCFRLVPLSLRPVWGSTIPASPCGDCTDVSRLGHWRRMGTVRGQHGNKRPN